MSTKSLEIILKATDNASKVIESATGKMSGKLDQLKAKFAGMSAAQKTGAAGAALEGAGLAAVAMWDKAGNAAIEYGKSVITVQRLTGGSAESASAFAAILDRYGVDGAAAGKVMKTLATQITAMDTSKSQTALHQMGIATQDASGKFRDTTSVLADVADYYAKADDKTKALALASKVLGRGYMTLLPILAGGKDKIDEITASAKENGLILGQDALDAVGKYAGATKDAAEAQKGMKIQFGLAIVPVKTFIMEGLAKVFGWYNKLSPGTKKLITYVGLAATALALVGGPLLILISILPAVAAGIGIVGGAMNALVVGPAGLVIGIIAAIIAIVVLCIKYHEQLAAGFRRIWGAIAGFFTAIWNAIKAAFWAFINFFKRNWKTFLEALLIIAGGPLGLVAALFIKYWKQIKAGFLAAGHAIKAAWQAVIAWFSSIPGKIKHAFAAAGKWLLSGGKAIITGLANGVHAGWDLLWKWLGNIARWVKQKLGDAGKWLLGIGADIIHGLWSGITGAIGWLGGKISSIGGSVKGFFKKALGISSPSKLTRGLGAFLPHGLALGILDGMPAVDRAVKSMSTALAVSVKAPAIGRAAFAGGAAAFVPSAARSAGYSAGRAGRPQELRIEIPLRLDGREVGRGLAKVMVHDGRAGAA